MAFEIINGELYSVQCDAVVELITRDNYIPECDDCSLEISELTSSNCKHIIKATMPAQTDMDTNEDQLRTAYRNIFQLIAQQGYQTVALPLSGFELNHIAPLVERRILSNELLNSLQSFDTLFLLLVNDNDGVYIDPVMRNGVKRFLEFIEQEKKERKYQENMLSMVSTGPIPAITDDQIDDYMRNHQSHNHQVAHHHGFFPSSQNTDNYSGNSQVSFNSAPLDHSHFSPTHGATLSESFYQMVLRKIDEKGFKNDAECYKKGNLTSSVFSEMRCKMDSYQPSKRTALAFCIALELPLNEASELLSKAGYSFSHSILTDVIVEYCINNKVFNIVDVNILLYEYGQKSLGHKVREDKR